MDLKMEFTGKLSYHDLMDNYPEFFYYDQQIAQSFKYWSILSVQMPVRRQIIDSYVADFQSGKVQIERSFPNLKNYQHLPNIVELTAWWMGYMRSQGNRHGMRSMMTPSSTEFEGGVLCVYFLVNTHLAVSPNVRKGQLLIFPDGTETTIP